MTYGRIISYNDEHRLLKIKHRKSIFHYYIHKSTANQFSRYLLKNAYVFFEIGIDSKTVNQVKCLHIKNIKKVYYHTNKKPIIYYDHQKIQQQIGQLLNGMKYKLFLDLEMSMNPFYKSKSFVSEIIQAGFVLVDEEDQVVETFDTFIQPVACPELTKRTVKFLHITQADVDHGISFLSFYKKLQEILIKYNPVIMVWGKNDIIALNEAYKLHSLETLEPISRFMNLMQVHKNYHMKKNDQGLFNVLKDYEGDVDHQSHNAYEDAYVTFLVYKHFKSSIKKRYAVL